MDPRLKAKVLLSALATRAGNVLDATGKQLNDTVLVTQRVLDMGEKDYPARQLVADVTALWVNGLASMVLVPLGLPIPGEPVFTQKSSDGGSSTGGGEH